MGWLCCHGIAQVEITSLAASPDPRHRTLVLGLANGILRVYHLTGAILVSTAGVAQTTLASNQSTDSASSQDAQSLRLLTTHNLGTTPITATAFAPDGGFKAHSLLVANQAGLMRVFQRPAAAANVVQVRGPCVIRQCVGRSATSTSDVRARSDATYSWR